MPIPTSSSLQGKPFLEHFENFQNIDIEDCLFTGREDPSEGRCL